MRRRQDLWLAALAVAALSVSACGPATGQQPAPPPAAQPAAPAPAGKPVAAPAAPAQPAAKPSAPQAGAKPAPVASGSQARYLMGSTNATSSVYPFWVTLGKLINDNVPSVNVTVVETGSTIDNIKLMHKGEMHFGLINEAIAYEARNGLKAWKDDPVKELRVVFLYHSQPSPVIVREDSGVKRLEDLNGKDFNAGVRGSATELHTKAMLDTLGVKPRYYVGTLADALAATKDRRIVGFAKSFASASVPDVSVVELQTAAAIRVLGPTREQEKLVSEKHPEIPFSEVEAGVFKADWNQQPIRAIAAVVGLATVEKMPADLVYRITKLAVEDNRSGGAGRLAQALAGVKDNDFAKLTLEMGKTSLHPGAAKYYQELGLSVPAQLLQP